MSPSNLKVWLYSGKSGFRLEMQVKKWKLMIKSTGLFVQTGNILQEVFNVL